MLEFLSINGGARLEGSVRVSGAKNSALPLLISTLLSSDWCELTNVPDLEDISVTIRLLESLGAEIEYNGHRVKVRVRRISGSETPYGLVKALRASFWVLGPVLARHGSARVALPGGDAIGSRPVDLHLKGLVKLGADIRMKHGTVIATAPGPLTPAKIDLDFPSVGATHQLMMTAALIPGETVLTGAAREPEIVEVAELLTKMGAEIEGAGSSTVVIRGRKELGSASQEVRGDRIEAATYLVAGAITAGKVTVKGISREKLGAVDQVLESMGCVLISGDNSITVSSDGRLKATSIVTAPYPGVATDVQPILMAATTRAEGTSVIEETIFDNRFGHVAEFRRLGASIRIEGRSALIDGVTTLSGAPVEATDIRAAAALVLMGLMADGETQVNDIHHLDRGYDGMVDKLRGLGARAARVPVYEEKELVFGC